MVIRTLTFLILILSSHATLSATFSAEVDRTQITTEEHLLLKLTLTNSDTRLRAQGVSPNIDLSRLTSLFDLGTPRAENRFNIYRNHGRSTSSISIELFPKNSGKFTIPSFSIDDLKTEAITINIIEAQNPAPEIFIKSGLSHEAVWLNQQLTAYIDLYHRTSLSEAKLGGELDSEPFIMDTFKLAQSERQESREGFNYNVTRISWAVFPSRSGDQTLYLPDLWVTTQSGRKQRFPVQKQLIEVKPLPATVPQNIIVGRVTLKQTELDNMPTVGQLSSWQVTLSTSALESTLPRALGTSPETPQIKLYRDAPLIQKNKSTKTLKYTATYLFSLMPVTAGRYTLPSIEVQFFDPDTGQVNKATLNGTEIQVAPSLSIQPTQMATVATENHPQPSSSHPSLIWQWLTIIFALLCVIISILWQRDRLTRTKTPITQKPRSKPSLASSPKSLLLNAFNSQTLEQGLNQWEQHHDVDPEIRNVVSAVQKASYRKGDMPSDIAIARAIKRINQVSVTKNTNASTENFYP